MKKRFRAIDGRKVVRQMTEEEQAENELVYMLSIIAPPVMIFLFALAGRMI